MTKENPYEEWDSKEATPYPDGNPDSGMVPYVESLREQGIITYGCCSGHPEEMYLDENGEYSHWSDRSACAYLILAPTEIDMEPLEDVGTIHHVYKEYKPNDSWTIKFNGLWQSEGCLRKEMKAIFESVGAEMP